MNGEFGYLLAFTTGLLGTLHCWGMCSGIAAGAFLPRALARGLLPHVQYHGTRILVYVLLGTGGAVIGRVLVQTGLVGKGQGILMMAAGGVILFVGLGMLGWLPTPLRRLFPPYGANHCCVDSLGVDVPVSGPQSRVRPWSSALWGLVNGLVPCSLVFSVAVHAAASADPLQAALLMLAFGLGTLPGMAAATVTGALLAERAQGLARRLAAVTLLLLGGWTLYQGAVFFDIVRGLANW